MRGGTKGGGKGGETMAERLARGTGFMHLGTRGVLFVLFSVFSVQCI